MIRKILAFLFLCSPLFISAQKRDKNIIKIANTITADDLQAHLKIIAGKEMQGRNTPSPGLEKAADYIESQFRLAGLQPGNRGSYRQQYPLYKDSMTGSFLKINGIESEINNDYQPQTNNYPAEMRFSEVVFAGYGISDGEVRDDYKDLDVSGKLVMIFDGTPPDYKSTQRGYRSPSSSYGKIITAMNKGVTALLIVSKNFPRSSMNTYSNWSRNSYRAAQPPFSFMISPAVAKKIMGNEAELFLNPSDPNREKQKNVVSKIYPAEIDLGYSKLTQTAYASNVLGILEGTDLKNEYVFITAHYDHLGMRDSVIYYGADDDGSGTTAVLELAKAFAKANQANKGPRRSIVFMTVSGEEKGLWGSAYYTDHPVFPLDSTTVDLNIDMIGRSDTTRKGDTTNYIYVVGDDKISTDLKMISEAINKTYTKLELDYKFNDPNDRNRIYFRSDHYNFAQKGVPIIFYYDGMLGADYHRPTDTPDKINFALYRKRVQLVFYTAWEMANRNEMLKRDLKLEIPKGF